MTATFKSAAPQAKPRRRIWLRLVLGVVAVVVVSVAAFAVLVFWPNPTVPANPPNMTPVATGTNNDWLSFDDFVPGIAIATDDLADDSHNYECTLAFVGRDASGAPIALTAGHCRKAGNSDRPYFTRSADPGTHIGLGQFTTSQTADEPTKVVKTAADGWADFAIIAIEPSLGVDDGINALVAGTYRISKVLDRHYLLNNDVTLCKFGFVSGETCGKVAVVTDTEVHAEVYSAAGDSGSPAYVKLGNNEVAAVGILRGSPKGEDNYSEFTLLAPILDATGATLRCGEQSCLRN